uniref:RING-type domain-containing protein n=1 Tax=Meloidogyne enterolobii TaxID=390850 RepID=A0A6V7UAS2_MELEN|nr:unnamed protein product [Meloidogyne enterolobii]
MKNLQEESKSKVSRWLADNLPYNTSSNLDVPVKSLNLDVAPTNSENKEPTKEIEEKQCSICLSKLSENPKHIIVGRKCNHIFHNDCIYGWLESDVYTLTCPTCREPFLDIKIPIQEPVFSDGTLFYEYQILLDQFPHTDYNSRNYFIQNQSSINDIDILRYIYTFRPPKHPSLSKSVELGYSRSKLATFDVEDIEENEEKKKEGIVIN